MTKTPRARRSRERGFALAVVLTMILLLSGIAAALHTSVMGNTVSAAAHFKAAAGFYAAESGINKGMGTYRNIFLNYGIPTGSPGTGDFAVNTFTLGPRTVTYQLAEVPGNPDLVIVPAGKPFAGLTAAEYKYTATATSAVQSGEVEANIGTQFNVDYIPLFQFLAFYQQDLEILPGVDMNLHGPVHTNGSLYLNANTALVVNELDPTIPSVHLSAAGSIYRGRKEASSCTGTVTISILDDADSDGVLDPQDVACGSGTTAMSSSALSTWLGSLLANQPVVTVPTPDALVVGSGEFWTKADLRIALDKGSPNGSGLLPIRVLNSSGAVDATLTSRLQNFMNAKPGRIFYNDVPTGSPSADPAGAAGSYSDAAQYAPAFPNDQKVYGCTPTDLAFGYTCTAGVSPNAIANETYASGVPTARRGGFYNNREHAWVYMLNVNVHDLLVWNRAQAAGSRLFDPADTTDGGVVLFLTVLGPNSSGVATPRYGVRVFGSPNLDFPSAADPTGITVVSDQGLYVEGNYNNGTGACSSHASCPKSPAALMADTMNVLSNAWSGAGHPTCQNDCQSFQALAYAQRDGSATEIRAAFLAGVDATTTNNYNGGLENYPRFHEDWNGELLYRGSFVSLGTPRHNNGPWCGTGSVCNIYDPPVRNWDYDTDFQTVENLPPLTPRFVSVEQILFTENFR
jgi:hypothetical protein